MMQIFGDKKKFALEFETEGSGASSFALWLNGNVLWGEVVDSAVVYVQWSSVNFLYELASNWTSIFYKQIFPGGSVPQLSASNYHFRVREMISNCAEERKKQIEKEYCAFGEENNIAVWFDGIILKEVLAYRLGSVVIVTSGDLACSLSVSEAKEIFGAVGDYILKQLTPSVYTEHAILAWQRHAVLDLDVVLQKSVGPSVSGAVKERIAGRWREEPGVWGEDVEESVAARMALAATVSQDELLHIFAVIERIEKGDLKKIEHVRKKLKIKDVIPWDVPFEDGYNLALSVRSYFRILDSECVDVEDVLSQQCGVPVSVADLAVQVDALAVWGKKRGPAIVVNGRENSRTSTRNGRRTALAHEFCHLLADTKMLLPVAEVLCGQSPPPIEKRANAFAAELLLPRRVAFRRAFGYENIVDAVASLAADYRVSKKVAMWQIYNHQEFRILPDNKQRYIERYVKDYLKIVGVAGYSLVQ